MSEARSGIIRQPGCPGSRFAHPGYDSRSSLSLLRPVDSPPGPFIGGTMRLKTILIAVAVLAVSFFVSLKAIDWLSPRGGNGAVLVGLPALPPVPRTSTIIAPIAITLAA